VPWKVNGLALLAVTRTTPGATATACPWAGSNCMLKVSFIRFLGDRLSRAETRLPFNTEAHIPKPAFRGLRPNQRGSDGHRNFGSPVHLERPSGEPRRADRHATRAGGRQ